MSGCYGLCQADAVLMPVSEDKLLLLNVGVNSDGVAIGLRVGEPVQRDHKVTRHVESFHLEIGIR